MDLDIHVATEPFPCLHENSPFYFTINLYASLIIQEMTGVDINIAHIRLGYICFHVDLSEVIVWKNVVSRGIR